MKRAIIIDGNSLMFRCYYGTINQLDFFIKNNVFPTNAIKTMMLIIFKILESNEYDYKIIAFDHKDKNFRKLDFNDYKANRKPTPENLIKQIPIIQEIMPHFGLDTFCISGIEADDVVGSASKLLSKHGVKCEIFSSDNDMLQLVDENINVIQFKKGISDFVTYNIENFSALKEGLTPIQITDYKGLCGDSSDNLQGVKGIGHKTAINLILKYESIEKMYENIDFIESKSIKEKLINGKENALKCKNLSKILLNYFDDKGIDFFNESKMNFKKIKEYISKYNFTGFNKYIKE